MRTLQRRFAVIRRYVLGILMVVPLFFAQGTQPQAALVTDAFGVTDITGLTVAGVGTFDIHFTADFYNGAYPGGDLFPGTASAFVTAINAVLNDFNSPPPVISPDHIINPTDPSELYAIPSSFGPGGTTLNRSLGICPASGIAFSLVCVGPYFSTTQVLTFPDATSTWAVPSPVPLPAALPLFGSALAMLGIVSWRRRRQAGA